MTFNTKPSPEYARLKAELDALEKESDDLYRRHRDSDAWIEPWGDLKRQITEIHAALQETPEQQYLNQIRAEEMAAHDRETAAELERRGRMVSVLSLNPDGEDLDLAAGTHYFSSAVLNHGLVPVDPDTPLMVVADMRQMSPAQVANCLRMMAKRIEEDDMLVCRGPVPEWWNRNANFDDSEWWADERTDGTFRHSRFLK